MAAAVSANIVRIPASFVPGYRLIARHLQFFPAIDDLQRDLQASQQVINLSVSLFILFQGTVPILWSGISEIYGRKIVYLSAYAIFTASQIGCALSKNQAMFLAFRIIGACGSSAGLTIGGIILLLLLCRELKQIVIRWRNNREEYCHTFSAEGTKLVYRPIYTISTNGEPGSAYTIFFRYLVHRLGLCLEAL